MVSFVDAPRDQYGVESICSMLPIAPSTFYAYAARSKNPPLQSRRTRGDGEVSAQIKRVWRENF